jgi:hypothetical protein
MLGDLGGIPSSYLNTSILPATMTKKIEKVTTAMRCEKVSTVMSRVKEIKGKG